MEQQVIRQLKKITRMKHIQLTSRGNTAIFAALYCARKLSRHQKILIPDQGGWFTFKKYPKYLELETENVNTDFGVIDLNHLKHQVPKCGALLYANPAGYYAEQPVADIYQACQGKCLVILDVTGSIGRQDYSRHCDFMIGSFGEDKPVNVGYGGFIATNRKELLEKPKEIFNLTQFDSKYYQPLLNKLNHLNERYAFYHKINKKIKRDLKDYHILHREKRGINVVVKLDRPEQKREIINYCHQNNFPYTKCPFYIRVKDKAICIEVKRMG